MKIIIYLFLLVVTSCENNIESDYVTYDCEVLESLYEESVAPILANQCTACHSSLHKSGNLALDSYDAAIDGIMNGHVLSRIIMDTSNPLFMPLGSEKLSQESIEVLQNFAEQLCL
jgi:hypothetical protein